MAVGYVLGRTAKESSARVLENMYATNELARK